MALGRGQVRLGEPELTESAEAIWGIPQMAGAKREIAYHYQEAHLAKFAR